MNEKYLFEVTDYEICRSAMLECIMSDMDWEGLYVIIEHCEDAIEFDISVQTQVELNQVIASFYNWTPEDEQPS